MRTQTSPVQIRAMKAMNGQSPLKVICPGKVYRRDDDDATHSFQFNQVEGLVIGKGIRMSDLKGTLLQFVQEMFGRQAHIRLRPSFFPFTEPSAEVDVTCSQCGGGGCKMCKGRAGWRFWCWHDPSARCSKRAATIPSRLAASHSAWACERIALLKYGIDDIRHFYTNDLRFLSQFARM